MDGKVKVEGRPLGSNEPACVGMNDGIVDGLTEPKTVGGLVCHPDSPNDTPIEGWRLGGLEGPGDGANERIMEGLLLGDSDALQSQQLTVCCWE